MTIPDRKAVLFLTLFAVLFLSFPSTSHAADMWTKFGRGMTNILSSPLEIFHQYSIRSKDENDFIAFMGAIPLGTLVGLKRAGIGLWEVFTFPRSPYDKLYIEPEFLIPSS